MNCRFCQTPLNLPFVDLGSAPPSNAYLTPAALSTPEKWYPLRVLVCAKCWLVQTEDFADAADLFNADYAYFSSFSRSWLEHSERFVSTMVDQFGLSAASHVVEVAANDGYLLQYVKARGIPCTGIEPTACTAAAARARGLTIIERFFGVQLGRELAAGGQAADLTAANNVLAHVPDINDFVGGFRELLKPQGVASFEFPHLLRLVEENQFDTIYHEHFSYLSLTAVARIFTANGLAIFAVEKLPTHGGSLRVLAQRIDSGRHPVSPSVAAILAEEQAAGITTPAFYTRFQAAADRVKNEFLRFLLQAQADGKRVAGYGAAAKGNTLINYAGVRPDLLPFVVDRNPAKQNKYLPGSRIPICDPDRIRTDRPDFVVILPWNIRQEVMAQLDFITIWGGRFVTAVPKLQISP